MSTTSIPPSHTANVHRMYCSLSATNPFAVICDSAFIPQENKNTLSHATSVAQHAELTIAHYLRRFKDSPIDEQMLMNAFDAAYDAITKTFKEKHSAIAVSGIIVALTRPQNTSDSSHHIPSQEIIIAGLGDIRVYQVDAQSISLAFLDTNASHIPSRLTPIERYGALKNALGQEKSRTLSIRRISVSSEKNLIAVPYDVNRTLSKKDLIAIATSAESTPSKISAKNRSKSLHIISTKTTHHRSSAQEHAAMPPPKILSQAHFRWCSLFSPEKIQWLKRMKNEILMTFLALAITGTAGLHIKIMRSSALSYPTSIEASTERSSHNSIQRENPRAHHARIKEDEERTLSIYPNDMQQHIAAMKKNLIEKEALISSMNTTLSSHEMRLAASREEIKNLSATTRLLRQSASEQSRAAKDQMSGMISRMTLLSNEYEHDKKKMAAEHEQLSHELLSLKKILSEKSKEVTGLSHQIAKKNDLLNEKEREFQKTVDILTTKIDEKERSLSELNAEHTTLIKARERDFYTTQKTFETRLTEQEEQLSREIALRQNLEKKLAEEREKRQAENATLLSEQTIHKDLLDAKVALEKKNLFLENSLDILSTEYNHLMNKIAAFEKIEGNPATTNGIFENTADEQLFSPQEKKIGSFSPLDEEDSFRVGYTSNEIEEHNENALTRIHLVAIGDTLTKIAVQYYGSAREWSKIYQANKDLIPNKDNIKVGTPLLIP